MDRRAATGVRLLVRALYYDLNFLLFSVYRHQRLASSPQLHLCGGLTESRASGCPWSVQIHRLEKRRWNGAEAGRLPMSADSCASSAWCWAVGFQVHIKRHTMSMWLTVLPNYSAPFIRAARNTPWPAGPRVDASPVMVQRRCAVRSAHQDLVHQINCTAHKMNRCKQLFLGLSVLLQLTLQEMQIG